MPLSNPEDKIYEEWGVTPPDRQPHGTETDIQYQMLRPITHGKWTQKGNTIVCGLCPMPHSATIPVDFILKGTDDKGLPILEKLGIHKS
jgi:hypothetical protein